MRKPFLLSILVAAAILLPACASPTPVATLPVASTPVAIQATPSTPPLVATEVPVSANPTQVEVTLADNTIESSLTTFQVGVPYTFVIKNTGRHAHNFNISEPVDAAGSLDATLQGALLAVGQDQLPVGGTATVDFTFPASAAGSTLEFSCLIRRHYEDGMKLPITVTQ